MRSQPVYTQEAVNIADFDADEMKIFNRQLTPTSASELAPPEVRVYLDNFSTMVERTDEEREALRTTGSLIEPHWDPKLRHDRGSRDSLYESLSEVVRMWVVDLPEASESSCWNVCR